MKHSIRVIMSSVIIILVVLAAAATSRYKAYAGIVIDENTVIQAEQAGSIAEHVGDYGWDSRGAYIKYYDQKGRISGDLGLVLFCDEDFIPRDRMWDKWDNRFPDWWGRMLAEKIRNSVSGAKLKAVREAFADSVTFECTWVIAIGLKDNSIGSGPYLTLRTDDTLRAAYMVDTSKLSPPEKLFTGDEMAGSLSTLLKGEKWGTTSQHVFSERNPYIYKVSINSYTVRLYATDCVKCAKDGKVNGDYCKHNKKDLMLRDIPMQYRGVRYVGTLSFLWEGQEAGYAEPEIRGYTRTPEKDDTSGLRGSAANGKISVYGDSTVYFAYSADNTGDPVTPEPSGAVTPTPTGGLTPTPSGPATPAPTGTPTPTPAGPAPSTPAPDEPDPITPVPREFDPIPAENTDATYRSIRLEAMDTMGKAVISSDIFDVRSAIPSTESVYIQASARNCLYRINAGTVTGKMPVEATVAVPYTLRWRDEDGVEMEESGVVETHTVVYRDYSFIHLDSLEVYLLDSITVTNRALSPAANVLKPGEAGIRLPAVRSPIVYGARTPAFGGNIDYPAGYSSYIVSSDPYIIDGGTNKPAIPVISPEEAYWTAENSIGQLRCRNDEFYFDSRSILGSSGWHTFGQGSLSVDMPGPQIVEFDSRRLFGRDGISIPASVRNGTYRAESRMVRYSLAASYGPAGAPYDTMLEVNPVTVHTPVYCEIGIGEADISDPNTAYFQENGPCPGDAFVIVAGRSNSLGSSGSEHKTGDFIISFDNTGNHPVYTSKLSGSYDYSSNISRINGGTYIEGNYLKFPFAVYLDTGNDGIESNDRRIPGNEWVLFSGSAKFYPAETVAEGYYTIEARTIAVNARNSDDRGQVLPRYSNTDINEYIAGDSVRIYVTGKLYGLTLYDISSKAEWGKVFSNNAGNKYLDNIPQLEKYSVWPSCDGTLNISSPDGKYGSDGIASKVFYYTCGVNNELGIRTGRNLKYTFPVIAGSHPDRTKSNKGVLKTGYRWKFRLKTAGRTMGLAGSSIEVTLSFRIMDENTVRNGVSVWIPAGRGILKEMPETIRIDSFTDSKDGIQVWDFEIFIPQGSRMVRNNRIFTLFGRNYSDLRSYITDKVLIDPGDDVWLKEGTVMMNFEIRALSPTGRIMYTYSPGTESCNMWKIEGQSLERTDYFGLKHSVRYGDIALIYINKGAVTDYIIDHQN